MKFYSNSVISSFDGELMQLIYQSFGTKILSFISNEEHVDQSITSVKKRGKGRENRERGKK